jgi:polyisoprenoid-binding protein YceI
MHPFFRALFAIVALGVTCYTGTCSATPIHQALSRKASSITFGVDSRSEALAMNGTITDFTGTILIDPSRIESARISFSTTLSSATLPPHQIMQAILLQSVLARVEQKRTSFESSRIEHSGGKRYLVHGTYSWGKGLRNLTLPVEITKATRSTTEIRFRAQEKFTAQEVPAELATVASQARGSSGWASARLVFIAANPPS